MQDMNELKLWMVVLFSALLKDFGMNMILCKFDTVQDQWKSYEDFAKFFFFSYIAWLFLGPIG